MKNRTNPAIARSLLPSHAVRFGDEVRREGGTADAACPLIVRRDDASRMHFADILYEAVDYYSIAIITRGTATQLFDETSCEAARGDLYVVPLGCRYASLHPENFATYTLLFTLDIFDSFTLSSLRQIPGFLAMFLTGNSRMPGKDGGRLLHLAPPEFERIEGLFSSIYAEYCLGSTDGRLITRIRFFELLVDLARIHNARTRSGAGKANSGYQEYSTITAAVQYLDENFARKVRVEAVAASCFLSPDAFGKHFFDQVGQTPRDYLSYLRIENAKRLLATTQLPVAEVGYESGYPDSAYFIRAFRLATGMTPGKFRKPTAA